MTRHTRTWIAAAGAAIAVSGLSHNAFAQDNTSGTMHASGVVIDLGVGYSYLKYGKTELLNRIDFLNDTVLDELVDHDGNTNGARIDLSVSGIKLGTIHGKDARLAVKGFYSQTESSQSNACEFVNLVSDCAIAPLYDPSAAFGAFDYSGGFFSQWVTNTSHEVTHWGVSTEVRFGGGSYVGGGLKDEPVYVPSEIEWVAGLGLRRIKQKVEFHGHDFGPDEDPVTLTEYIDTRYIGSYFGINVRKQAGHGVIIGIAADGGLYAAKTDYEGRYTATQTLSNGTIDQSLELQDAKLAFIGTGRLDVSKNFGKFEAGVYGIGEFYSYAPTIAHNNTDVASLKILQGNNVGTSIDDGSAFGFTVGGNVRIPLN